MDNAILARGEKTTTETNHKKIILIAATIAVALSFILLISSTSTAAREIKSHEHDQYCYSYDYYEDFYWDSLNNELQFYKMDCPYVVTDGVNLGISRFFNGPVLLPILVAFAGLAIGLYKKKASEGYVITVTKQTVSIDYAFGKQLDLPIGSILSLFKEGGYNLTIISSERNLTLKDMIGRDEVYNAIAQLLPSATNKSPANNEQILAKGYPPAIKPVFLVLLILIGAAVVIAAIVAQTMAVFILGLIPFGLVLLLYRLARTPYLVVTDKRVFYVSDFGRKLSLPADKITVIVTHWWFNQLHVAAPIGRIHLFGVKNTAELYDTITALINEKQ